MVNSFELYYINYSAVSTEKSYNANTALNLSLELDKSYLIDLFHLLQLPIIYIQFNVVLLYRSSSSQKIPISALKRTLLKAQWSKWINETESPPKKHIFAVYTYPVMMFPDKYMTTFH